MQLLCRVQVSGYILDFLIPLNSLHNVTVHPLSDSATTSSFPLLRDHAPPLSISVVWRGLNTTMSLGCCCHGEETSLRHKLGLWWFSERFIAAVGKQSMTLRFLRDLSAGEMGLTS